MDSSPTHLKLRILTPAWERGKLSNFLVTRGYNPLLSEKSFNLMAVKLRLVTSHNILQYKQESDVNGYYYRY
jgi:hypothetical protein